MSHVFLKSKRLVYGKSTAFFDTPPTEKGNNKKQANKS
jgi:hypothetical protein